MLELAAALVAIGAGGSGALLLWRQRYDIDQGFWLVVSLGGLLSISPIIGKLSGAPTSAYGDYGQMLVRTPSWGPIVERIGLAACVLLLLVYALTYIRPTAQINSAAVFWLLAVAAGSIAVALSGGIFASPRWLLALLIAAVLIVTPRTRGAALGAVAVSVTIQLLTWVPLLIGYDSWVRNCRTDKCGPLGTLVSGVYLNENATALMMVCGTAFALFLQRSLARTVLVASSVVGIYLTGSRSALIGGVAVVLLLLIAELGSANGRRALALGVLWAAIAANLLIPLTASPGDYTNRTAVWRFVLELPADQYLTGRGWSSLYSLFLTSDAVEGASSYSLHNEILDTVYISGVLGLALLGLTAWSIVRGTSNRDKFATISAVAVIAATGVLETPVSVGEINWLSWVVVALVLCGVAAPTESDTPSPSSEKNRRGGDEGAISLRN